MTPALATRSAQVAHYAAVRARLYRLPAPAPLSMPKPDWSAPVIREIYPTLERRIAAVLIECSLHPRPRANTIIAATSSVFGIGVVEITGKSRSIEISEARHIAMTICAVLLDSAHGSYPEISKAFGGRDPTTVCYGVHKYRARVESVMEMPRHYG